jgi:hypothetical protein
MKHERVRLVAHHSCSQLMRAVKAKHETYEGRQNRQKQRGKQLSLAEMKRGRRIEVRHLLGGCRATERRPPTG